MNSSPPIICIVDDETDILSSFSDGLKAQYSIQSFSHPERALEAFEQGLKPTVLITDMKMPGMDGLGLIENLKPLNLQSKVIMMSGHANREDVIRTLNSGVDCFLEKPFTMKQLREAIVQMIGAVATVGLNLERVRQLEAMVIELKNLNQIYFERLARAENHVLEHLPQVYSEKKEVAKLLLSLKEEKDVDRAISQLENILQFKQYQIKRISA